jgi:hypothetical protein
MAERAREPRGASAPVLKWLGRLLLALLVSLLVGLVIGTALRLRLERPVVYLGLAVPGLPLRLGNAGAPVFDPGHGEEQVREPIQHAEQRLG